MPRTSSKYSSISFESQGCDMIITVWHKQLFGEYYDHATHRLKPDEIQLLKEECEECQKHDKPGPGKKKFPKKKKKTK